MKRSTERRVRLIQWWVGVYTRTAPTEDAQNRRAELQSDLFDEVQHTLECGAPEYRLRRRIGFRAARGIPADLAWRISTECIPGRLNWHLNNPATVLTTAGILLIPLGFLTDSSRNGAENWTSAGFLGGLGLILNSLVFAFCLVSGKSILQNGRRSRPLSLARLRVSAFCVLTAMWTLAGVWRFAPEPLTMVSTVGWVGFGVALVCFLALAALSLLTRIVPFDFGKIPS